MSLPLASPVAGLGPSLDGALLRGFSVMVAVSALAGLATWWLGRHGPEPVARLRWSWTGAPGPEPVGRRVLRVGLAGLFLVDGLLMLQPNLPAGLVPQQLPGLSAAPGWLVRIVQPGLEVWSRHPVDADLAVFGVEVGLGVLLLLGGRGLLARAVLVVAVAVSLSGWVIGQQLGGLSVAGAAWLTGAPGSALVYALAGIVLLAPWRWWIGGPAPVLAVRLVAGSLVLGAWLQALPWEGSWTAGGIAADLARGAANQQPSALARPLTALSAVATSHPAIVNGVLIAVLLCLGVGLWVRPFARLPANATLLLLAATWWFGQDFGVLGGTGTDPGTAAPLALLLAAGSIARPDRPPAPTLGERLAPVRRALPASARMPAGTALAALGLGGVLAPVLLAGSLAGPADLDAAMIDSGGGVQALEPHPAPDFALIDQAGHPLRLSQLRGKLTLVTFLDPVCSDNCPVIANQLDAADRQLGSLASRIQIVALDTNPVFHSVQDTATFSTEHGLDDLPNWHFLAGPLPALQSALTAYDITVALPAVGMISHAQGIYFIAQDGQAVAYLGDGANAGLTDSYTRMVRDEVRKLLS
jgi:cytochrome oxidase Cu insertion factor (SCO1/SenC/PrrC family)